MWCRPLDGRPSPKGVRVDTPKKYSAQQGIKKNAKESKECRCENGRHPCFTKGCQLLPFTTRPGPLKYLAHPRHPQHTTSHSPNLPPPLLPSRLPSIPRSIAHNFTSSLPQPSLQLSHRSREVAGISLSVADISARLRKRRVLFPRLLPCLEAIPCSGLRAFRCIVSNGSGVCICSVCVATSQAIQASMKPTSLPLDM